MLAYSAFLLPFISHLEITKHMSICRLHIKNGAFLGKGAGHP